MVHPSYAGCWQTEPLANTIGLQVDQFNFVGVQFAGILFSVFFYVRLRGPDTSPTVRHLYCLVVGILTVWVCNGWETWHLVLQAGVCYLLMNILPAQIMHICVLMFSLSYLVTVCLYRYILPEDMQFLDITFPITMSVQKLSSLAFSITDYSRYKLDKNSLTESQRKRAISRPPNLLQFFSYIFYFQGILAGPICFYNDYSDFIEGRHIETRLNAQNSEAKEEKVKVDPKSISPMRVVSFKMALLLVWIFMYTYVSPVLAPTALNADAEFIKRHSLLSRIGYLYISMLCHRSKYYLTWLLSDIVYNASGFGFNGIDKHGNSKWDMLSNVRVEKIETATSFKTYIDNWNIMTTHWLRYVCYERAPFLCTHLTYLLSAIWHGVYPGFYCTFLSAIWFTLAGRKIRKNIRPIFQVSATRRVVYEVLTWFGTQVPIAYVVLPFIYHTVAPFIHFYNSIFWCFHVIVALILIIPLEAIRPKESASRPAALALDTDLNHAPLSNSNSSAAHHKHS